MKTAHKTPFLL